MAVVGAGKLARLGDGRTGRAWYYNGTDAKTLGAQIPMRLGYSSVPNMLQMDYFTWAHRGGSNNWSEMSLHAYTQCVARGWGALEVSLARTKDGVWFGLHDLNLDRISGRPSPDIRTMTWEEVQAYQIVIGGGAPRPLMRWEELLDAYSATHILINDIKHSLYDPVARGEYFAMMGKYGGPERHIVKWAGGDTLIAPFARQMGYECWGYFYEADTQQADFQSKASQWTLVGLSWDASDTAWSKLRATGKGMVAHILPNQAAADTALANKLRPGRPSGLPIGLMCAEAVGITPAKQ